jgi:lysophospholipase L1-like esterase
MHRLLPLAATTIAAAIALAGSSAGSRLDHPGFVRGRVVRFLALGDSYTIGEGVPESHRWPMQLASLLERQGYRVEVQIVARTGWTADELRVGVQESQVFPPYDLVSLLIGVNNQYRGRSLGEFREQFSYLLSEAVGYAGGDAGRVLVFSIPDWGPTPFAHGRDTGRIAHEIDLFNTVNREEAQEAGVHYVDVTAESRADAGRSGFLAADGLHPSGKMYAAWAQLALPATLQALSR